MLLAGSEVRNVVIGTLLAEEVVRHVAKNNFSWLSAVVPNVYESASPVRLGDLDSGVRLGYISPHTHEWIPKLCSYISVSRMSSSKQVAAAVIILDECGVFGRKRNNRKRREMWAKKWLLGRDRYTHLHLLNFIRNDSPEEYLRLP